MFKVQEETIRKTFSSCNTDTITRLDWVTGERLNKFNKKRSQTKPGWISNPKKVFEKKLEKGNDHLAKQKLKHQRDIYNLWNNNNQFCEMLGDLEVRSGCDTLRTDGLNLVKNEKWEQTEEILSANKALISMKYISKRHQKLGQKNGKLKKKNGKCAILVYDKNVRIETQKTESFIEVFV